LTSDPGEHVAIHTPGGQSGNYWHSNGSDHIYTDGGHRTVKYRRRTDSGQHRKVGLVGLCYLVLCKTPIANIAVVSICCSIFRCSIPVYIILIIIKNLCT